MTAIQFFQNILSILQESILYAVVNPFKVGSSNLYLINLISTTVMISLVLFILRKLVKI